MSVDRSPRELVEQPLPQRPSLVALPLAQEARVEDRPARAQVRVERLEPSVEAPVRRVAGSGRVEVLAAARAAAEGGGVLRAELCHVLLDARDELVAVVDLAEHVLKL